MSPALFKTWLLLCMLLPMKTSAHVLGMCSEGETRYQTCNNNTWCTNFSYLPSETRCTHLCNEMDNTCEDYCKDGKLPCQSIDPLHTVTTTITITQTSIASTRTTRVLGTQASTVTSLPASLEERITLTRFYSKVTSAIPLSPSPSQTPVFTVTQRTPNINCINGSNTISTATMGVVTGVLLVSLVMVIAGWIWTCVRMRSPSQVKNHTDKKKYTSTYIEVKANPAYIATSYEGHMNEPDGEDIYESL